MHEIIRKVRIPEQPRTGITEEREYFAKLQNDDRLRRKRDRRAKLFSALGVRFGRVRGRRR